MYALQSWSNTLFSDVNQCFPYFSLRAYLRFFSINDLMNKQCLLMGVAGPSQVELLWGDEKQGQHCIQKQSQHRKRKWEKTRSGVYYCTSNPASACTESNFSLIQQKAFLLLFLFITLDDVISHTAHSCFHFLNLVESLDSCIQHKYDFRGFSYQKSSPFLAVITNKYGVIESCLVASQGVQSDL